MSGKKVLVYGGCGALGRTLVDFFKGKQYVCILYLMGDA